jgi:uncharacterized protein
VNSESRDTTTTYLSDMSITEHPEHPEHTERTELALVEQDPADQPRYGDLLESRYSRRAVLTGVAASAATAVGAAIVLPSLPAVAQVSSATPAAGAGAAAGAAAGAGFTTPTNVTFSALSSFPITDDTVRVPDGYVVDVIMRWGDPVVKGAPAFDVSKQTASSQAAQSGYNHDFQAFFPLGTAGTEGVLFVNHEYTDGSKMFPGYSSPARAELAKLKEWVDIELEAHGGTVVELERADGGKGPWKTRFGTRNRRITANTKMTFSGPAAKDPRLGSSVVGMLNNCGGGVTPWGTVLTAEENFNQYFANAARVADPIARESHARYGISAGESPRAWERVYPGRFDSSVNPDEPYKYGWIVEIDPDDPNSTPIKHTALGRFKHEAATTVIAPTGQLVVYTGDDERFDYFYKYVSWGTYDAAAGKANSKLLTEGTLYVAKLRPDGTAEWIPLVFGSRLELSGPKFDSQSDILIRTRQAADAVGATKMDRPEDIETNPKTGKVYVALTNNSNRRTVVADEAERASNPRVDNRTGHILEISEAKNNAAAREFTWNVFIMAGDPGIGTLVDSPAGNRKGTDLYFGGYKGQVSPIGAPDNVAFSPDGMMWLATDGAPSAINRNDALHAVITEGPNRGRVAQFLSVPAGAETCGPEFSPDQLTLFIAIQHPGEDGTLARAGDLGSNTQSSWPDGPGTVPRPASIAIRHKDGKKIGS